MNIRNVGNYMIVNGYGVKQIYSKTRMLQISDNKTYYVDLTNGKLIKFGERIVKWFKKEVKNEH